jgi:cytochrome c-type biogenesis protein CcmH
MVTVAFYLSATAMIAFALLLIVLPLLRGGPRRETSRGLFSTALAIVVLLPGTAIGLYAHLGTPAVLNGSIPRVAEAGSPTNASVHQWMDAAHRYDKEQQPRDARNAYESVLAIDAGNAEAMVGWVEADMTQHADFAIEAPARRMLERAIALEPDNQRALWLLGIGEFQQKNYAAASATWKHLQALLGDGSALTQPVARQIALADAKAGTTAPPSTN